METICNRKQMKNTMQLQTNEAHYATGNEWRTLCNCKKLKHTMQLQKNKSDYATANK